MKKIKIIPMLLLTNILLITSCSTNKESTSSLNSSQTSVTDTSNIENTNLNSSQALDLFKKLVESKTFGISYFYKNQTYNDVYTPEYIYLDESKNGVFLLPSYLNGYNKIAYSYSINNNQVELGLLQSSSSKPITSLDDISFFSYLSKVKFNNTTFKKKGEKIYTTNLNIIKSLAGFLNFSTNTSLITSITFISYVNNKLTYKLDISEENLIKLGLTENDITGIIYDISNANNSLVKSYLDNFKLPTNKVSANQAKRLLNDSFESKTKVTYITSKSNIEVEVGNYALRYTPSQIEIEQSYSNVKTKTIYNKKASYDSDGNQTNSIAELEYIDHLNNIKKKETNILWSNITKTYIKNVIDLNDIYQQSDSKYLYLGLNYNSIFYSLTQFNPKSTLESMYFTASDGIITGLIAKTSFFQLENNGVYYKMTYNISFSETPSSITELQPYPDKGEATRKIKDAFDVFNNESTIFKMDVVEYSSDLNISLKYHAIKTKDTYFYYEDGSNSGRGYHYKNNKIYPFYVDDNGKVTITEKEHEGKLTDYTKFTISERVFALSDDNKTINIQDIGPENPTDYIFVGESEISQYYQSGLTMTLNDSNKIENMYYTSLIPNPADGVYYPIQGQYTFTYDNNIDIPNDLKGKLKTAEYIPPTNNQ